MDLADLGFSTTLPMEAESIVRLDRRVFYMDNHLRVPPVS